MEEKVLLKYLKDKYNYNDSVMKILEMIIPSIIEYYGEENKSRVINSFIETPICFVKDNNDVNEFVESLGIKDKIYFGTIGNGAYEEHYQLNSNGSLERIPFILIRDVELSDDKLDTIIHECCHMISNYGQSKIIDGKIIKIFGFNKEIYEIEDGKIVKKESENNSLEEGFNELDARMITKMITGRPVPNGNYGLFYEYAEQLMINSELRKIIINSRLNGDMNVFSTILGPDIAIKYIEALELYDKKNRKKFPTREDKKEYSKTLVGNIIEVGKLAREYVESKYQQQSSIGGRKK